jgi:hypothetical protein
LPLLTTDKILDKAMDRFTEESVIVQLADGRYDKDWGAKDVIGDQVAIRLPMYARSRRGEEADPQSLEERSVFLKIPAAFGSDSYFTDRQLSMELNDFTDQALNPHMDAIIAAVARDATKTVGQSVSNFVGTPGVVPTSLNTYTAAGRLLTQGGTITGLTNRYMLVDAAMDEQASIANRLFFNPTAEISERYKTASMAGKLGWFGGFTWYMEQALYQHTVGALGAAGTTPKVNGAVASGATSVVMNGFNVSVTGILKRGDKLDFAGSAMVHPVLGSIYPADLQAFTVAADCNSDGGGNVTATLTEAIEFGTPYANVSALPADQALVRVWGQSAGAAQAAISGLTFSVGIAMDKSALVYASPDLIVPLDVDRLSGMVRSKKLKTAIRLWRASDVNKGRVITRLDLLMGFLVGQPRKACLICSA